jgi:hypothetical protein
MAVFPLGVCLFLEGLQTYWIMGPPQYSMASSYLSAKTLFPNKVMFEVPDRTQIWGTLLYPMHGTVLSYTTQLLGMNSLCHRKTWLDSSLSLGSVLYLLWDALDKSATCHRINFL